VVWRRLRWRRWRAAWGVGVGGRGVAVVSREAAVATAATSRRHCGQLTVSVSSGATHAVLTTLLHAATRTHVSALGLSLAHIRCSPHADGPPLSHVWMITLALPQVWVIKFLAAPTSKSDRAIMLAMHQYARGDAERARQKLLDDGVLHSSYTPQQARAGWLVLLLCGKASPHPSFSLLSSLIPSLHTSPQMWLCKSAPPPRSSPVRSQVLDRSTYLFQVAEQN
jgi:hypothetical protein